MLTAALVGLALGAVVGGAIGTRLARRRAADIRVADVEAAFQRGRGEATVMRREVTRADVESTSRWRLKLISTGGYWRVELYTPEGRAAYSKSLVATSEEALESARLFLACERLDHVGGALCQMARGELRMSSGRV